MTFLSAKLDSMLNGSCSGSLNKTHKMKATFQAYNWNSCTQLLARMNERFATISRSARCLLLYRGLFARSTDDDESEMGDMQHQPIHTHLFRQNQTQCFSACRSLRHSQSANKVLLIQIQSNIRLLHAIPLAVTIGMRVHVKSQPNGNSHTPFLHVILLQMRSEQRKKCAFPFIHGHASSFAPM